MSKLLSRLIEVLALNDAFLPGLPGPRPAVVQINRLPLLPQQLDEALRQGPNLVIHLAPNLALERQITLPIGAASHADQAIALTLRQSMPAQARGLLWSHEEVERGQQKRVYRVFIVKEEPILRLVKDLQSRAAAVEGIFIATAPKTPIWRAQARHGAGLKIWVCLAALAVAGVSIASIAALESRIGETRQIVETRRSNVAALETRLTTLSKQAEEVEAERLGLSDAMAQFGADTGRLGVLTDLSTLLPDATWVSELTISNNRVVLAAFTSGDVADTISLLQGASRVKAVALEGPVSFDSYSGQNRFTVAIQLAEPANAP
ncbi:PilN domain-containing protein [Neotabrizicola sp. sgz301269]|uniref:PilN domain-containing protein n=1 Tax=Neotabrizicola sp. sgz301269 TaxID=3276282 RepID=UPI00376FECEC